MSCLAAARKSLLCFLGALAATSATTITSAEWTAVINMAGRQRMLSQKMSKEFLLVAKGIDAATNKQNLQSTMNLYNASLIKLVSGSTADSIPAPPTTAIASQLATVEGLWNTYSALLTSNVDLSPIPSSVLASVAQQSVPILTEMNAAVGMYATAAGTVAPGAVVNIAGRQRMLSQRMSKEALLVGLSVDTANSLSALEATKNLFVTSNAGLVNGSTSLSLSATTDACILAQLGVVAGIWAQFEPLIDGVISSGSASTTVLTTIAQLNPTLLTESNAAVTMYVKHAANEPTCAPSNVGTTSSAVVGPRPDAAVAVAATVMLGLSLLLS